MKGPAHDKTRRPAVGVDTYREDPLYPRIARAVATIIERGKVVAPVDVLVAMGLSSTSRTGGWGVCPTWNESSTATLRGSRGCCASSGSTHTTSSSYPPAPFICAGARDRSSGSVSRSPGTRSSRKHTGGTSCGPERIRSLGPRRNWDVRRNRSIGHRPFHDREN
jgi:hypothetical protein